MTWKRFTVLNAASAFVWASLLIGGGFLLGEAVASSVFSNWAAMSVALLVLFVLLAGLLHWRMRKTFADQDLSPVSVSASASASASASRSASAFSAAQAPAASTATGDAVGRTLR